jgi:beta-N-acetylhexosaminidase
MPGAVVYDCEAALPNADEKAFFRDADPWGFILFARHCESAEAVERVCAELRDCVGRDAPILIDQEGGRVARMKPPVFPAHPAMGAFGRLFALDASAARDAARLNARLLGEMVSSLGVTFNCAPMLDVVQADSSATVIGDRALAGDAAAVAALGRAVMEGLLEGGAVPVIKHLPGHGRARVDSHYDLPRVEASDDDLRIVDFAPFRALADAPAGMTGHVVYEAIDPDRPATMSPIVIETIIREEIGFGGLLFSDDLKMNALSGDIGARARAALDAGCDIALCCNYSLEHKLATERDMRPLTRSAEARAARALDAQRVATPIADRTEAYQRLAMLISPALVA